MLSLSLLKTEFRLHSSQEMFYTELSPDSRASIHLTRRLWCKMINCSLTHITSSRTITTILKPPGLPEFNSCSSISDRQFDKCDVILSRVPPDFYPPITSWNRYLPDQCVPRVIASFVVRDQVFSCFHAVETFVAQKWNS